MGACHSPPRIMGPISHLIHPLCPSRALPSLPSACPHLYPMSPNEVIIAYPSWQTKFPLPTELSGNQRGKPREFHFREVGSKVTAWFLLNPGPMETGPALSQWGSERLITFTGYKSPPSFPCPCPEPWRESPDSLQGGAGQKLPHPPYQTYLPALPDPDLSWVQPQERLSPGKSNLLRGRKLTCLKAGWWAKTKPPKKTQSKQVMWQENLGTRLPPANAPIYRESLHDQLQAGTSAGFSSSPPLTLCPQHWLPAHGSNHRDWQVDRPSATVYLPGMWVITRWACILCTYKTKMLPTKWWHSGSSLLTRCILFSLKAFLDGFRMGFTVYPSLSHMHEKKNVSEVHWESVQSCPSHRCPLCHEKHRDSHRKDVALLWGAPHSCLPGGSPVCWHHSATFEVHHECLHLTKAAEKVHPIFGGARKKENVPLHW